MITTDEAQEIIKTVESASDGYWFPLVTVAACFSVVIALLLYIWNQTQKNNEKRHTATEEIIKELADSKHTNDLILQRLEILVESHDKKLIGL
tara:strand:- start:50 stop:328 length:279 start_codon:yes stop_codon:yes gene_type:complete